MANKEIVYRKVSSPEDILGHTAVRWDVFVTEQGVAPVLEIDARDFAPSTVHIVAVNNDGEVIGAARLLPDTQGEPGASKTFHVGRVAVRPRWRGKGVGEGIMRFAGAVAEESGYRGEAVELVLDAQVDAEGFYRRLGYEPTDRKPFFDAGILHQEMAKTTWGTR